MPIALTNMVDILKTRWTVLNKCGKHQPHNVTQSEGKDSLHVQGKRCYDRKQSSYLAD